MGGKYCNISKIKDDPQMKKYGYVSSKDKNNFFTATKDVFIWLGYKCILMRLVSGNVGGICTQLNH